MDFASSHWDGRSFSCVGCANGVSNGHACLHGCSPDAHVSQPQSDNRRVWRAYRTAGAIRQRHGTVRRTRLSTIFSSLRSEEEERQQLEAQLQHAQRLESLGILAGGIAHDFNNLLTPVVVHTSLLSDTLKDDQQLSKHIAAIESAAEHAADLCKQMLAFSGRGRFELKAVDLSEVVHNIERLLDVGIATNVSVEKNLEANLPAVQGDSRQIQQVVMNLVTNASDASL